MSDDNEKSVDVEISWADHSTILVDQILGFTNVDDISRVAFGQLTFIPKSATPLGKPVVTLVGSTKAWKRIRDQLSIVIKNAESEPSVSLGAPEIDE